MDVTSALAGIQANLEYALRMVGSISRETITAVEHQQNNSPELCMRLDMVKDYLCYAQNHIDEIEGSVRRSYKDDIESVLKSFDL
jgi:hypothetical protein